MTETTAGPGQKPAKPAPTVVLGISYGYAHRLKTLLLTGSSDQELRDALIHELDTQLDREKKEITNGR